MNGLNRIELGVATKKIDYNGNIADPSTGEPWISDPETATRDGDVYVQTRWIQDLNRFGKPISLTRDEWVAEAKTYHEGGTPKSEGFEQIMSKPATIITVGVSTHLCYLLFCPKPVYRASIDR